MKIGIDPEWHPDQKGVSITAEWPRRWLRFAAYYGQPPGSHIGVWRTDTGWVHGWNLRVGRRIVGPTLTFLAHTRTGPRRYAGRVE